MFRLYINFMIYSSCIYFIRIMIYFIRIMLLTIVFYYSSSLKITSSAFSEGSFLPYKYI